MKVLNIGEVEVVMEFQMSSETLGYLSLSESSQ